MNELRPVLVYGIKEININEYIDIDFLNKNGLEIYTEKVILNDEDDNIGVSFVYGVLPEKCLWNDYRVNKRLKTIVDDFCIKYNLKTPEFYFCIDGGWCIDNCNKYIPTIEKKKEDKSYTESFLS